MKKILILFISQFVALSAFSQQDNDLLKEQIEMTAADTQRLMLSFSNLNFMRNYEYFNEIEEGFTLFGYELNPRLAFMPGKYLRLEAGLFVRKDFGNDKYTQVHPTFTAKVSRNGYSMLLGNIEGSLNHRLIEPLYDFDNVINNRLENGGQILIDKKRIWTDLWIDWQRAIYHGSPFQEQIWAGISSRVTVAGADKNFKLIIPVQGLVFHNGGQIESEDSSSHVLTLINLAPGVMLKWDSPDKNSFVQELRTENYWAYYSNRSGTKRTAFNSGDGIYLNGSVKTRYFIEAMISYWNGNKFISPVGAPLYQSISSRYSGVTESNRQLIFLRLMYEQQWVKDFYAGIRFEPYYDLNNKLLEYSYSFFASYKKDFSLVKLKRL